MNLPTRTNWRTWEPNPIVVKELRQAVRSWAVTGMLLLFLAVQFLVTFGYLAGQSISISPNQALGRDIFMWYLGAATVVGFILVPVYVGGRLTAERMEGNVDMLYITTLSAARIIRGKLLCGTYLTVLFFSVCAPFMVFTNLLRGIDLPTVFMLLGIAFLLSVLSLQAAIFLSCLPASKGLKLLVGVPAGCFMVGLVIFMVGVAHDLMREGVGSRLGTWNFWGPALSLLFIGLLLFGFLHLAAIALISPPSANRALPLRSYVTGAWLLTLIVAMIWSVFEASPWPVAAWSSFAIGAFTLSLLISAAEGDDQSVRIRRTIPEPDLKRSAAFFFYSGTAGGLAWTVLLGVATVLLSGLMLEGKLLDTLSTLWAGRSAPHRGGGSNTDELVVVEIAFFLYALAYVLFGLFIHRRFQPHRAPIFAALCAVALPVLWAIVPNLVLFFLNQLSWDALQERQLGNIFNIFAMKDRSFIVDHLLCAIVMAAIGVLLNAEWFLAQRRVFVPLRRETQPVNPPPQP
jgi:hypothetical protein